jgi:hypothetical protein
MKFNMASKPDCNQGSRRAKFNNRLVAFSSSSLMVGGIMLGIMLNHPGAQDNGCVKKTGIETATTYGPGATVREGDVVGKKEFGFIQPASIVWRVAGIDTGGVKLAYELDAGADNAALSQRDSATVAYGQDTVVSSGGRDSIRIRVERVDRASASVTAAFVR